MSETKLSVIIHTPRIDVVVLIQVEGVVPSAEHIHGVLCVSLLDLERLFVLVSCLKLSTNLSSVGIAPSVYLFTFG